MGWIQNRYTHHKCVPVHSILPVSLCGTLSCLVEATTNHYFHRKNFHYEQHYKNAIMLGLEVLRKMENSEDIQEMESETKKKQKLFL